MTRTSLVGLGFLLALTTSVIAAPALRSEVTVRSEIVTVGDMFDNAGILAEEGLFRAPEPGTTGTVTIDAVRQAASLVGLTEFEAGGIERVRVARPAAVVDAEFLTHLITVDLSERGILAPDMIADTRFDRPDLVINAEAVVDPARLINLRYMPQSGEFSARFLIAGKDEPVDVTGTIDLMVEAPHLVDTMPAGTVLTQDDIEMRLVPLTTAETSGSARMEDLIGKALARQSRAGMLLKVNDVRAPELVSRNDIVTVFLRTGPMTLTVKGQALSAAAEGDTIPVLNLTTKKVLYGRATAAGTIEITTQPLTVAGL
jgi:flagellar basal body P-ring formation protein FlgA